MSLSLGWNNLIEVYNKLTSNGVKLCPVAHTYITAHIGVLLSKDSEFLCAKIPDVDGELVPVPCTAESGCRTSNIAPHLLHDNLCYVASLPKYEQRHKKYIQQLDDYVNKNPKDEYADIIYKYVKSGTLLSDLGDILNKKITCPLKKVNIIFCVYGMQNEGVDLDWTEYYLKTLKSNGVCTVTGNRDYIPNVYPAQIMSPSGMERLFLDESGVGYIASQKIIHMLQYFIYASKNSKRVEAETHIKNYINTDIQEKELKEWIDREYPGKWDKFIDILNI